MDGERQRVGKQTHSTVLSVFVCNSTQVRGFVGCHKMLETDLYMLVCLAFNHWHTGIDDFMHYPQCVLAIHSSKRLLVEQITPPPFLLADAIINLTLAKGQRHEGREGMTAYYLTKVWRVKGICNALISVYVRLHSSWFFSLVIDEALSTTFKWQK